MKTAYKHLPTGRYYKHRTSGDIYHLITLANTTATKNGYVPTAVYISTKTGETFARSIQSFELRFELVT